MLPSSRIIIRISIPIILLIVTESLTGLLLPSIYSAETANWATQTYSQDFIDLVIVVPALILSCIYINKNNVLSLYTCGGIYLYLSYTFTIYTFELHFNSLFLCYCATFGLSAYGFIYVLHCLHLHTKSLYAQQIKGSLFMSWFFTGIAIFFSLLWLSEIVPALLSHRLPASVMLTGLPVNPAQALDLSLLLPLVFMTGLWLRQGKTIAKVLAPVVAIFFVLMSLTVAIIALFMSGSDNLLIALVMVLMALISFILFVHCFGRTKRSLTI